MEPVQANVVDNEEPFEPCPTPLSWQDVLREFRAQSESWTVDLDGRSVSGRSIGEGPPLYFLNGLSGNLDLYSLTVWLLREDYRCVLFDYPTGLRSASDLPALLFAIADKFQHETFSVFSTGAGCMTAFAAMKQSSRINKAIVQGGFANCRLSLTERIASSLGAWCSGKLGSVPGAIRILRQNHRPWFPPFDESRWSFAEENLAGTPIARLAGMAGLLKKFDCRDSLADIAPRTMLVRCEGDSPIQVEAQDKLEQAMPDVPVQWLHTCGRLPFLTHPHRLKRIVLDFLSDVSGS